MYKARIHGGDAAGEITYRLLSSQLQCVVSMHLHVDNKAFIITLFGIAPLSKMAFSRVAIGGYRLEITSATLRVARAYNL